MALNERLAEFEQVDWNALVDSDPQLAQKLSLQRDALKSKRDELSNGLNQNIKPNDSRRSSQKPNKSKKRNAR